LIDGAEQPDLACLLTLLLERCPNTRLVLAARISRQLDGEHLLVLDGFPLPDADESDVQVLGSNDAVGYFVEVAAQSGTRLNLQRDAATVAALVRELDGLPLALKLVGRMTRMFSLEQLLGSVQQQLSVVRDGSSPALGELMPALVASFMRSWETLAPAEQSVLSRLAVFPADFDVAAARAVGQSELPVLVSLVDRSMLRAVGNGRLSLHAGVRACLMDVGPPEDVVVASYIAYYAGQLAAVAHLAKVKSVRPIREFLLSEAAHVEWTWNLAVNRRRYSALTSMAQALAGELHGLGAPQDYGEWMNIARAQWETDRDVPPTVRTVLLAGSARAAYVRNNDQLAAQLAGRALATAVQEGMTETQIFCLWTLANCRTEGNSAADATAFATRAEDLRQRMVGQAYDGAMLRTSVVNRYIAGEYLDGIRLADEYIRISQSFEDFATLAFLLIVKAYSLVALGERSAAGVLLDEIGAVLDGARLSPNAQVRFLCDRVQIAMSLPDLIRAAHLLNQANALAAGFPLLYPQRTTLQLTNALLEGKTGEFQPTGPRLVALLEVVADGVSSKTANSTLLIAAKWFRWAGDVSACLDILRLGRSVFVHPITLNEAHSLLRELGEQPIADDGAVALVDLRAVAIKVRDRVLRQLDKHGKNGTEGAEPGKQWSSAPPLAVQ
jgi:hypothetical protein